MIDTTWMNGWVEVYDRFSLVHRFALLVSGSIGQLVLGLDF